MHRHLLAPAAPHVAAAGPAALLVMIAVACALTAAAFVVLLVHRPE